MRWDDFPGVTFEDVVQKREAGNMEFMASEECDHVAGGKERMFWLDIEQLIRSRSSMKESFLTCGELLNFGVLHVEHYISSWATLLWNCVQCQNESKDISIFNASSNLYAQKSAYIAKHGLKDFEAAEINKLALEYSQKPLNIPKNATIIAICLGATSRHLNLDPLKHAVRTHKTQEQVSDIINDLNYALINTVLPAYSSHIDNGFEYRFYIAADTSDFLFRETGDVIQRIFKVLFNEKPASLQILLLNNTIKKPGPAFNLAAKVAYNHGADYIYRTNDDSAPDTPWASDFVSILQNNRPQNFGVVGPTSPEGNHNILTHDFVHRTHLDIFDAYYPVVLTSWYLDDWISHIYGNHFTCRLPDVIVNHMVKYKKDKADHKMVSNRVQSRYEIEDAEGSECLLQYELHLAHRRIRSWMRRNGLDFEYY